MIAERYQEIMEMLMVDWLRHEKKQDFPIKINRSLSTYLSSQLMDCVGQANCI